MSALYGFAFTEAALKYLETVVPAKINGQIKRRIEALAANPTPPRAKKLVGVMDGEYPVYRVRQGDYRILYSVRPIIIVILDIGHRNWSFTVGSDKYLNCRVFQLRRVRCSAMRPFRAMRAENRESLESFTSPGCRTKRVLALHCTIRS